MSKAIRADCAIAMPRWLRFLDTMKQASVQYMWTSVLAKTCSTCVLLSSKLLFLLRLYGIVQKRSVQ